MIDDDLKYLHNDCYFLINVLSFLASHLMPTVAVPAPVLIFPQTLHFRGGN